MKIFLATLKWTYVLILVLLAILLLAQMFGHPLVPNEQISGFLTILFLFMLFFGAFGLLVRSTPQSRW